MTGRRTNVRAAAIIGEQRNVQGVVARAARRAGVAALVPRGVSRGELGETVSDLKGFRAHLSWPTGDVSYRNHARRHIERIVARRHALEALVGNPFRRVFLAGTSAGAYFVTHLMLRGDFPADGYAA